MLLFMYIVAAICRSCSHLDTETRLLCSSASSYTLSVSVTSHPAHLINSSDFVSFRCFCHLLHLLDLVFSAYLDSMLRTFFLFSTITCNVSCVSCSNSRVFVCIFHHDNDPVLVLLLNRVKIKGVL